MPNLTIFALLGLLVRGGLNPLPPKLKILVFGLRSKVRGVLNFALRTDFSPSLNFSNFYRSDLEIRGVEPTTPRDENPCFWPKIKSRECFRLGIAH